MIKLPKARPCKVCKARFKPESAYQWWCCSEHETEYKASCIDKQRQQQSASRLRSLEKQKQPKQVKKTAIKTVIKPIRACTPSAADYAQIAINRYVCLRDNGKPCISCGQTMTDSGFNMIECGHYRSRGAAGHLRFNLKNMAGQCHHCNQTLSGNRLGFRRGLIERIGIDSVNTLEQDNTPRKFTTEYLKRLKSIFIKKARRLEACQRQITYLETA